MTKRDAATLGVRILAGYVLVSAVIRVIALPAGIWTMLLTARSSHSLHVNRALVAGTGSIGPAWDLVTAVALWLLCSRIVGWICPADDCGSRLRQLSMRGWFSTAAFVVGVWLMAVALMNLPGATYLSSLASAQRHASNAGFGDMLKNYTRLAYCGAELLVALPLIFGSARLGKRLSCLDDNNASDTSLPCIGIRLIALQSAVTGTQSVTSFVVPWLLPAAFPTGHNVVRSLDATNIWLTLAWFVWSSIVALALWFLAPRLSSLINRGCSQSEPETPSPVASA